MTSGPAPAGTGRAAFEASRGFALDPFQRESLDAIDAGQSVLVAAPTGSGKTVVAEYAIERALAEGQKAFYTTPLKALSNQKYADLARAHGTSRVGLLTGDNSINGDAPVVVMTTEVLRNMIYSASPTLAGLRYVVLDEVHYLQNPYRGAVWEEVIIHLDPTVDLVCLSATVSNAEEFADWIETVRGQTKAVIEERRPVRLTHLYMVGDRSSERSLLLPTFLESGPDDLRPNPEAARLDSKAVRRPRLFTPRRLEVIERLDDEGMLPAIYFIFSRAGCDQAVQACVAGGLRLTDPEGRGELRRLTEAKLSHLTPPDLDVLGYGPWMAGLEAGFAAHHAGLVPPMKEVVEEAFLRGLVKVAFATETLSLGINMPARTVVIEKLSKFTGERHEFLTPGEYTQLTGRAGRRGIDEVGYAVVLSSQFVPFDQVAALASTRSYALRSSFRPTYNMAANLVRRYPPDMARHLLNLSFAQYGSDREVVKLERQLERSASLLASHRRGAECELGDVDQYRALVAERQARPPKVDTTGLDELKPGDVLNRRGGRMVVLQRQRGKGGEVKILALTPDRGVVRFSAGELSGSLTPIGAIELPRPFAPKSPAFRRAVADSLRQAKSRLAEGEARRRAHVPPEWDEEDRAGRPESHPVARCPDLADHLRWAERADRLARDVDRLGRRVRGRTESLARQFDRVLRVLEAWGYVDLPSGGGSGSSPGGSSSWELTPAGAVLTRLYTETDLLVAEAVRAGHLDGLNPASLAAACSFFTFEARGPAAENPGARGRFPNLTVRQRFVEVERIWRDLHAAESDAGLPETRPPDPGFAAHAHAWASGRPLDEILGADELTGGDFVRNVKQLIDLLRQIAEVAPDLTTAAAARHASDALFRGVVAASSAVGPSR